MIHFFIGTKAQFIKMMPVMVELTNRNISFRYVDSGQHAELTRTLRRCFGLEEPDVLLDNRSFDVTSILEAGCWAGRMAWSCLTRRRWVRQDVFPGGGVCLIHGDTLSTLLGMVMASAAGIQVAHVEAGLRSFCLWDPFPEELVRLGCMRRADLLFAPSDDAEHNLEQVKASGRIVNMGANTVVDSLRLARGIPASVEIPSQPFLLATCHRLETISRSRRLWRVVELLNCFARRMDVVFVMHKTTDRYLRRFRLADRLTKDVRIIGMQDYASFAALLRAAKAVLTDGGSIQEECFYLDKPCLVLRNRTERPDGLGKNAVLWKFDHVVAEEFASRIERLGEATEPYWPSPSVKIVDTLIEMGFVNV